MGEKTFTGVGKEFLGGRLVKIRRHYTVFWLKNYVNLVRKISWKVKLAESFSGHKINNYNNSTFTFRKNNVNKKLKQKALMHFFTKIN